VISIGGRARLDENVDARLLRRRGGAALAGGHIDAGESAEGFVSEDGFTGGEGGLFDDQFALGAGLDEAGEVLVEKLRRAGGDAQALEDRHPVAEATGRERQAVARLVKATGSQP